MGAIIKFFARQRIDDDLEVAVEQTVVQFAGACIAESQLQPLVFVSSGAIRSTISSGEMVLMMPSLSGG
ncbi:MAG: hypothetical protein WA801_04535, partial [Pseudolabrys sp.]